MNTVSRLNNRYEIIREIGDGGFGKTFLVRDHQMPSARQCVVKQLKPLHDKAEIYEIVKERFQREAAILEKLGAHNQIPSLYAYFSEADLFYLVEEYVEGETLSQRVEHSGVLSEDAVRSILKQLLPVIVHIHQQGIVHRDIKPDNILLRQSDQKPVMIDFGAVKETMSTMFNTQGNSTRSIVVGTPGYMPSEQLAGRPMFVSDLYSLGLTALYLLTGKTPGEIDTAPDTGRIRWHGYAAAVSEEFSQFLDQAIQVNPQARFASAQDMYFALNSLDVGGMMTLPPNPGMQPTSALPAQPAPTTPAMPAAVPTPAMSSPTVASMPPGMEPTYPTQPVMPAPMTVPQSSGYYPPPPARGEWKKAVMTGGIIGFSILIGAVVLRGPSNPFAAVLPTPSSTSRSNSQSDVASNNRTDTPKTDMNNLDKGSTSTTKSSGDVPPSNASSRSGSVAPAPVVPAPAPQPVAPAAPAVSPEEAQRRAAGTNATVVGKAGSKNIRSGPGTQYGKKHVAYPGDRVTILATSRDAGGYTWRKVYFPKSGAEGWIASQLLELDGGNGRPMESRTPVRIPMAPKVQPRRRRATNATIAGAPGSKNIRSGPGTKYRKKHIAYTGDRIKILGRSQDSGGYKWYKVYFPKSGAQGWIAAQLVAVD